MSKLQYENAEYLKGMARWRCLRCGVINVGVGPKCHCRMPPALASDHEVLEEFQVDFIAEIREVFERGKTVGEIAHDYEMEPELVRNLLGDSKPPEVGEYARGIVAEVTALALKEGMYQEPLQFYEREIIRNSVLKELRDMNKCFECGECPLECECGVPSKSKD